MSPRIDRCPNPWMEGNQEGIAYLDVNSALAELNETKAWPIFLFHFNIGKHSARYDLQIVAPAPLHEASLNCRAFSFFHHQHTQVGVLNRRRLVHIKCSNHQPNGAHQRPSCLNTALLKTPISVLFIACPLIMPSKQETSMIQAIDQSQELGNGNKGVYSNPQWLVVICISILFSPRLYHVMCVCYQGDLWDAHERTKLLAAGSLHFYGRPD